MRVGFCRRAVIATLYKIYNERTIYPVAALCAWLWFSMYFKVLLYLGGVFGGGPKTLTPHSRDAVVQHDIVQFKVMVLCLSPSHHENIEKVSRSDHPEWYSPAGVLNPVNYGI